MEKVDKRDRAPVFRTRLAEAMAARGLTQAELARQTGVDRSTISALLQSGTRLPNAQLAADCARALGISADWLLGLSGRPEPIADLLAASLTLTEAPYLWRDAAHLAKLKDAAIFAKMNEELVAKRGMRMLNVTYYGKRHLTTGKKEVRTPADMAGFKLRVPPVDVFQAMADAWGAKAELSLGNALLTTAFTSASGNTNMQNPWSGYPGYTSVQVEDFNRDGEDAWMFRAGYNFQSVPGLSLYGLYVDGSDPDSPTEYAKEELDFNVQWSPPEGVLKGLMVRSRLVAGEPVLEEKLSRSLAGVLASMLPGGKRAVAIRVSAESTAGGFILPNDKVDVIQTVTQAAKNGDMENLGKTILTNIRVLAIDPRRFLPGETATLEADYPGDLPSGRYRVVVTVEANKKSIVRTADLVVP